MNAKIKKPKRPSWKTGPYGMERIVTDGGTTFYFNRNGVFDTTGKKMTVCKFATLGRPKK